MERATPKLVSSNSTRKGREFEEKILGFPCYWSWQGAPEWAKRDTARCLQMVRKNQPWDPTDPGDPDDSKNHFAQDLHADVCVELGVEEWSEVALYTAVGSPLDRFHGIDAFFEFHGTIVSIDLTVGRKGSHKADLVI